MSVLYNEGGETDKHKDTAVLLERQEINSNIDSATVNVGAL